MKNRILSLSLAAALALSLTVPAFATAVTTPDASTGLYGSETDLTGSTKVPTIKVTVPTTGTVQVNPYKMEVTVGTDKITSQIISATGFIKNESDVAIAVSATTTGEIVQGSAAVFGTAAPTKTTTTKTIFTYLEVVDSADGSTEPTTWATAYDRAKHVIVAARATTVKDIITLGAGATTATHAAYRLTGSVAEAPAKPWSADDKINVNIAFTFTPIAPSTT